MILSCDTSTEAVTGPIYAVLLSFCFFIVLSAGQIYLFYRWRKVEIYEDARNYLRLSARILRGHMAIGKKSHLIFLPVVLLVLAMVYSRVELPVFYVIVTSFVIAVGIASYMQPAYNRKLYNTYKPILDDIDSILKNMDEAV